MYRILTVLFAGVLTGCVTVTNLTLPKRFDPPTSGPTAQLTISSESWNMGFTRHVGAMDGCFCSSSPPEHIATLGAMTRGSSDYLDKGQFVSSLTFSVPASGEEFRISVVDNLTRRDGGKLMQVICQPHVGFVPEAGKSYQIKYKRDGNRCDFEVAEIGNSRVPLTLKKYPVCKPQGSGSWWFTEEIDKLCAANPHLYPPRPKPSE